MKLSWKQVGCSMGICFTIGSIRLRGGFWVLILINFDTVSEIWEIWEDERTVALMEPRFQQAGTV